MNTPLGWHWETTVTGSELAELEANAEREMRRFFGDIHDHDYVMEIVTGDLVIQRDGSGIKTGEYISYTARVRVSYTNYEAQQ